MVVRKALHLLWLRFWLLLKQPSFIIHARSPTFHKIAIVGDSFAEGVGDRVDGFTAAGLTRHLQAALDKNRATYKQRWQARRVGRRCALYTCVRVTCARDCARRC